MRINDAFTVPANHAGAQINKSKGCGAASAAYGYARRHGTDKWQFRYNRNDDDSVTIYCTNSTETYADIIVALSFNYL